MHSKISKYGARVYFYEDGVTLVKQTVKREATGKYVIDSRADGSQRERHVEVGDRENLADAILAAGRGEL